MATLIKGITANLENVQSLDDAREQHANLAKIDANYNEKGYAVFAEYDNGLSATAATNAVLVNDFFAIIQGRLCKLEAPTIVDAILGGTGYINLVLDLNAPANNQLYLEASTSNTPIQNDCLNNESGKFEAPLFMYTSTASAVGTVTPISGVAINNDFVEKLNVVNPQEIQGPLNINSGNTISILNLKSNSTGDKDITFKKSTGERVGLIRYKNNEDGYSLFANYYDDPNTPISSFRFDKTGAYVNNNQLLEVRNAFTQTSADGRYLKLSGGTLTGDLRIDGRLSPIRLTGVDTSAFSPYTSYWTNGNTRLKLTHNNSDDSILLYSYNTAGAPSNGLAITSGSVTHKANNKQLAYKDDVILNSGDKNVTGSFNISSSSTPFNITNVTDATLTSIGDVLNLSGKHVGRFMYKGSGTNGEVWAVGYNSSGSSILVGTKATTDGVYDYGLGGILTLNASTITRNISIIETQIEMQNKIDSQQNQIDLLNAQMQAIINGVEVPTSLKSTKVQNDEIIKLNNELARLQAELKTQLELDVEIARRGQNE